MDPFLTTVLYIAVFVIGLSLLGFAAKKGVDSLKLYIDRKRLEAHERAQKAAALPHYGGSSMKHTGKK
ncbi:MAG: hypothetical protein V1820_00490 [archaeon]